VGNIKNKKNSERTKRCLIFGHLRKENGPPNAGAERERRGEERQLRKNKGQALRDKREFPSKRSRRDLPPKNQIDKRLVTYNERHRIWSS